VACQGRLISATRNRNIQTLAKQDFWLGTSMPFQRVKAKCGAARKGVFSQVQVDCHEN
jgi:hypothetical protein